MSKSQRLPTHTASNNDRNMMNAMETTHQGTTTAKPQLKEFDVDPKRVSFALDGFSDETLTQLRDGINRIIESRKRR